MSLNDTQNQTLANHIRANQDPTVVAALTIRNDQAIADWYNVESATDVWREAATRTQLFEAMNISQFDTLSAGKRDAWKLMIEQANFTPIDFGRQQNRNAVRDIWPAAQADNILTSMLRKATRGETVFGGSVEASGSVSGTDLQVEIILTLNDISNCLNNF